VGYRVGNAYEAAAEEERRAAWDALPRRTRILLRLRQMAMIALLIGFVASALAGATGLL
jgi:hypothetical protein